MLCEYEEASVKYCAFLTLKYSNKFIPKARFATEYLNVSFNPANENDICAAYCPIVSLCERDVDNYGEFISEQSFDVTKPIVPQILSAYKRTTPRSKYGNHPFLKGASCIVADDGLPAFGYACKRDYQLFLKKLRAKIKYYCDEDVRFFLVSEYGPKTYRPHFHVLIWFNSKKHSPVCNPIVVKVGSTALSITPLAATSVAHMLPLTLILVPLCLIAIELQTHRLRLIRDIATTLVVPFFSLVCRCYKIVPYPLLRHFSLKFLAKCDMFPQPCKITLPLYRDFRLFLGMMTEEYYNYLYLLRNSYVKNHKAFP